MTEDEMFGWHHRLDRHEFEQAPGICDGQGNMACCSPWSTYKGCNEKLFHFAIQLTTVDTANFATDICAGNTEFQIQLQENLSGSAKGPFYNWFKHIHFIYFKICLEI